jgi:hypothetical protein
MVLVIRRAQAEDFKKVPPRVNLPPELVAAGLGEGMCDELVGAERRAVRRFAVEGLVGVLHWLLVGVGVMARTHTLRMRTRVAPLQTHTPCSGLHYVLSLVGSAQSNVRSLLERKLLMYSGHLGGGWLVSEGVSGSTGREFAKNLIDVGRDVHVREHPPFDCLLSKKKAVVYPR